jgi:tetrahydromethanopterin S-methyltransferase subunit H
MLALWYIISAVAGILHAPKDDKCLPIISAASAVLALLGSTTEAMRLYIVFIAGVSGNRPCIAKTEETSAAVVNSAFATSLQRK